MLAGDKRTLWEIRGLIHQRVEFMQLRVKENERVFPTSEGIDFLGYVIYGHNRVRLRKRNKKNAARALHRTKSVKRRQLRAMQTRQLPQFVLSFNRYKNDRFQGFRH